MADKPKFDRALAIAVVRELMPLIVPHTERFVVAGSLRRLLRSVGDIEFLYIPKTEREPDGLFEQKTFYPLDRTLDELIRDGVLVKRPNKLGSTCWGKENKLALHVKTGVPIDFFSTTHKHWYVSLVVRTGSKENNVRLAASAEKLGRKLHAYRHGVEMEDGRLVEPRSEQELFELCGVPYLEPHQR